jgi:hypothetical protein
MTETTRWIERSEVVIVLPANPAEWTDAEIDAAIAQLNADGLKRMLSAALRLAEQKRNEKEGAA